MFTSLGTAVGWLWSRIKSAATIKPIAEDDDEDPISVGSLAEVQPLLEEMDYHLSKWGVNTHWFSSQELTWLPREKLYAIPPRHMWDDMARTITAVAQPLRKKMGIPFYLRVYRPRWYNEKTSDAKNSRHIYFQALDIFLTGPDNTPENRRRLALEAARLFVQRPQLDMGLGIYDADGDGIPSNIHIDIGFLRRHWREARVWIEAAKAQS